MSTIDLYQLFRRIPDATDDEAKAAAASIPQVGQVNEMATKADLHRLEIKLTDLEIKLTDLEIKMADLETKLTRLIFSSAVVVIVVVSAITKLT